MLSDDAYNDAKDLLSKVLITDKSDTFSVPLYGSLVITLIVL